MSLSTFLFGAAVFVAAYMLIFMSPTAQGQQAHTQAAFTQWAKQCKPDDFHYGVTEDEHGTRAFIVTCSPGGGL